MIRKAKIFIVFLLIVVSGILLLVVSMKKNTVDIGFVKSGKAIFIYDEEDIEIPLSNDELSILCSIFVNKKMYKDNPSCGFSEDISIKFNDSQTFCIARDTCPIIYWKEKRRYFRISEDEKMQLYCLLENYGFVFPCI